MKYVIDRFEGNFAVCVDDDGKKIDILKENLPEGAEEGFTIYDEDGVYKIDLKDTEERKHRVQDRKNQFKNMQ